ncbi:hypothetical protein U1Q18_036850, partial [Sarracenia purpurea var. burkii]
IRQLLCAREQREEQRKKGERKEMKKRRGEKENPSRKSSQRHHRQTVPPPPVNPDLGFEFLHPLSDGIAASVSYHRVTSGISSVTERGRKA